MPMGTYGLASLITEWAGAKFCHSVFIIEVNV